MKRQFRNKKGEFCTALEWKREYEFSQNSYFPRFVNTYEGAHQALASMESAKLAFLSFAEMAIFGFPNPKICCGGGISVAFESDRVRVRVGKPGHDDDVVLAKIFKEYGYYDSPETIVRAVKKAVDDTIACQREFVDMLNAGEVEVPDNY